MTEHCDPGYPQYPTPPEDYPKNSFKIEPCKWLKEHDAAIIAAAIAEHEGNRDESSLAALQKINDALQKLYPNDFALQINAKQLGQLQAEHDNQVQKKERGRVLDELQDHNDARLEGLEILFKTPKEQRCESAQDVYLKEAYFELTLVKHLIQSLREGERK